MKPQRNPKEAPPKPLTRGTGVGVGVGVGIGVGENPAIKEFHEALDRRAEEIRRLFTGDESRLLFQALRNEVMNLDRAIQRGAVTEDIGDLKETRRQTHRLLWAIFRGDKRFLLGDPPETR